MSFNKSSLATWQLACYVLLIIFLVPLMVAIEKHKTFLSLNFCGAHLVHIMFHFFGV